MKYLLFAFILWRQQKEYKDAFKEFLNEQKKFADSEIAKAVVAAGKVLDEMNTILRTLRNRVVTAAPFFPNGIPPMHLPAVPSLKISIEDPVLTLTDKIKARRNQ